MSRVPEMDHDRSVVSDQQSSRLAVGSIWMLKDAQKRATDRVEQNMLARTACDNAMARIDGHIVQRALVSNKRHCWRDFQRVKPTTLAFEVADSAYDNRRVSGACSYISTSWTHADACDNVRVVLEELESQGSIRGIKHFDRIVPEPACNHNACVGNESEEPRVERQSLIERVAKPKQSRRVGLCLRARHKVNMRNTLVDVDNLPRFEF